MSIEKIKNMIELENQFDVELQWPWEKTYGDSWWEADAVKAAGKPNRAGEISLSDMREYCEDHPGKNYCWYAA